jgi:hypothetical protein
VNLLVLDPGTGELCGPASAVAAVLAGEADGGLPATVAAAARAPRLRVWIDGLEPVTELLGDDAACVLLTGRPHGERAVLPLTRDEAPVALAARLGLGPRPVPEPPAVRLPAGAMATLIGRREAHGHGLAAPVAAALQRRLDAGVRHWSVRVASGGRRRNLEVLEGAGGIWRLAPVGDLVELAPTTTTAVLRELVALLRTPPDVRRPP